MASAKATPMALVALAAPVLLAGLAAVKTIRQFRRRRYFEERLGSEALS